MTYVIAVADPVNEHGLELLRGTPECEVVYVAGKPDQLSHQLPRAHALLVRSETKVSDAMTDQGGLNPGQHLTDRLTLSCGPAFAEANRDEHECQREDRAAHAGQF